MTHRGVGLGSYGKGFGELFNKGRTWRYQEGTVYEGLNVLTGGRLVQITSKIPSHTKIL